MRLFVPPSTDLGDIRHAKGTEGTLLLAKFQEDSSKTWGFGTENSVYDCKVSKLFMNITACTVVQVVV